MKTFKVNQGEALKSRWSLSYIFDLEEVVLVLDTCRLVLQSRDTAQNGEYFLANAVIIRIAVSPTLADMTFVIRQKS
jgi:hypothetical protein